MDSGSDSDASHISATPPRNPIPDPPKPGFRVPNPPKLSHRPKSIPRNPSKSKIRSTPKSSDPPAPEVSLSEELANLHGMPVVNVSQLAYVPDRSASFSRLVLSRRPSIDPSEFLIGGRGESSSDFVASSSSGEASLKVPERPKRSRPNGVRFIAPVEQLKRPDCVAEVKGRPCDAAVGRPDDGKTILNEKVNPRRVHSNFVGFGESREPAKLPKNGREGNFVRLNINGRGRRFTFKNRSNNGRSISSRSRRYRRKPVAGKHETPAGDDFDSGILVEQRRSSNCSNQLLEEAVTVAGEHPSDENLLRLLKLTHGYDSFREGQLESIKRVVAGESTMLMLPTGAGKSLCYELPALILPGVTLVVSPLVALMMDQLRKLPSVIPGGLFSSTQTIEEASETLRRLHEGTIKVLFVSPERLLNAEFLSLFVDGLSISVLVIDEAHCISEWSHNFRPSYLRLKSSILRRKLSVQCILAMTATATVQTFHDITCALEIQPSNRIKICQVRENLQLFVTLSENRLKDLLLLMKTSPLTDMHSIIVYCKFQNETDLVSKYLCDNNIPSKAYHSGIPAKNRGRIQELFCSNKLRVVVATVAFGMGLDKSDVQAVLHYSMPESLEEYIQETGRAGRDGKLSYCHLLLDISACYKLRSLCFSDGVDEYAVSKFLAYIFSNDVHLTGQICSLVKESMSRKFDMKEEVLLTILTQLEISDEQYITLLPPLNATCSLYFHKTPPMLLADKNILVASILNKSEVKDGHYVFDIPTISNKILVGTVDLINMLQDLKSLGEVTYDLKDPAFCYTIRKRPDDYCCLSMNITERLCQVERCKVQKLDAMFNVAWSAVKECNGVNGCSNSLHTPCIQRKTLDYFDGKDDALNDVALFKMARKSPFLGADIKVFLRSNSCMNFTPRAVARIMHGISSPAFTSSFWSKSHFWGRYVEVDFAIVMEAAKVELMNFVGKQSN
ncbi:ATP-dependent DNA helicase Q-like 5 [Zingiber officinale]|uniref:ATP-dependent DNA helicase Q-like 5 n=1 Tax=Zingiber officinale TaxID=94328 RepID=UPI001C4AFB4D|nr:ATP-dependent DNA helicase Q-like 5 [Zingiber officinale]